MSEILGVFITQTYYFIPKDLLGYLMVQLSTTSEEKGDILWIETDKIT